MGFNWHTNACVEFCQPICLFKTSFNVNSNDYVSQFISMKRLLIFLLKYKPGDLPLNPEALIPMDDDDEYYEEELDLDVNEFTGEHRALVEKLNKEVGSYYNNCFECLDEAFKLFLKQLNKEVTQEFDSQMLQLPEDLVPVIKSYHQHEMMNFELKAREAGCDGEDDTSLRLVYKTYYPEESGIDCGRFASNIPWGISLTEIDTMDIKKKETICNLMQFILQKIGLKPITKPGWYLYTEASGG